VTLVVDHDPGFKAARSYPHTPTKIQRCWSCSRKGIMRSNPSRLIADQRQHCRHPLWFPPQWWEQLRHRPYDGNLTGAQPIRCPNALSSKRNCATRSRGWGGPNKGELTEGRVVPYSTHGRHRFRGGALATTRNSEDTSKDSRGRGFGHPPTSQGKRQGTIQEPDWWRDEDRPRPVFSLTARPTRVLFSSRCDEL
jgi:hypothetical protein